LEHREQPVRDDDLAPASERYWLIHANGGRQLIDPREFDLETLAEQARRVGGRLVFERWIGQSTPPGALPATPVPRFEPPVSALAPLFRSRLDRVHRCKIDFKTEVLHRPTNRVLGNYYRTRRLIRIYSHDTQLGRRPIEELFDTYLHEVAHHLEYTEYDTFDAANCGRVRGTMHSRLFWKILGELKTRWAGSANAPTW
jgi:hypothetical protein